MNSSCQRPCPSWVAEVQIISENVWVAVPRLRLRHTGVSPMRLWTRMQSPWSGMDAAPAGVTRGTQSLTTPLLLADMSVGFGIVVLIIQMLGWRVDTNSAVTAPPPVLCGGPRSASRPVHRSL